MRKLILISAFVTASILASASVQAQNLGANDAIESASPDGAMAKPQGAGKQAQASKSSKSRAVRRESDEQKARRIAAKYGVSW
jgi:negative regulator of sigma E activity